MAQSIRAWLKEQDPDVWHVTADYLNWDNSTHVVKWIVSQPQCDKATAAKLFWLAGPDFFACTLARGEDLPGWAESWPIVETVLKNWRRGFYQRSELAWPDDEGRACLANYAKSISTVPGADKALDIPADLFGPLPGRQPRVPQDKTPQENAELWDMLNRQGTWAGPRPGSEQWHAEREKAAQAEKPSSIWDRLFR